MKISSGRFIKEISHITFFTCFRNDKIIELADKLQKAGFSAFDSLHIAVAEQSKADIFVTTDDKIHKLYLKNPDLLKIKIKNPVDVVRELLI